MNRTRITSAVVACCTIAGVALVGAEPAKAAPAPATHAAPAGGKVAPLSGRKADTSAVFSGVRKITIDGRSVNVSCSGRQVRDMPVVVLLAGLGDGLEKMADLQRNLSRKGRVCSYDRLGEGASSKPGGPQTLDSTGRVLTGVLNHVAGDSPVVLAGHSLGGLIAARYAPDHRDTVRGLVLMDATSPTQAADTIDRIPATATGDAAALRAQTLSVLRGDNPEQLATPDGPVRSAGDIPVEVVKHGKPYLAAFPQYGPGMEQAWTAGEHQWLKVSGRSRFEVAGKSEHYIYLDQPQLAAHTIERVTSQAAHRHC
jgi:pimeloyl-ACP methyl ester carboxylesterase